ncbi:MAG: glucokinase, partial [Gammaproteobacteria bacterium]|nr:glucokinase [Gammaproteobacteria bacterium]
MWILAGDIGGTNTRLQLVETKIHAIEYHARISYASQEYENLSDIVKRFLQQTGMDVQIQEACFAVAGPVRGKMAKVTNLPWQLDAEQLQINLDIPSVRLINDFQAIGYGISILEGNALLTLQQGKPELYGRRALIGAGTGLGVTLLTWQTDHYQPWPSEGGHVDFAPTNELEMELLAYLKTKYSHVSYELLLSGSG